MRKVALIGCGGINSWVAKHLFDLAKVFEKDIIVTAFDKDDVEEKNIKRFNQNYEVEHLCLQKAESLAKRYNFMFENIFITEENVDKLEPFDDIIVGVDNHKTRKVLYDYAIKNKKYLLDLRAQGTIMGFTIVDGKKDMDYYNAKYFSNPETMKRTGSCQLASDIENDHIENANKAIAFFGVNCVYLKHLRDEEVATDEWKFAY